MERVGSLINKLKEQFDQNAGKDAILLTAQMLLAELQLQQNNATNSSKKVSVIMPAHHANGRTTTDDKIVIIPDETKTRKTDFEEHTIDEKQTEQPQPFFQKTELPKNNWMFDVPHDVPTLAQHDKVIYELKENPEEENSLNDKLRSNKNELADKLQEAPIKDLKKAIGINDRFLFISELFRGDETMYERSIKTINSFSILPEAEFWIQRELKLKLAWNESNPVVEQFDQLIRRRFS